MTVLILGFLTSWFSTSAGVICPAKGEEHIPEDAGPEEIVCALSGAKAKEVWEHCPDDALVVAADTIVWHEGRALGKPHSEEEAAKMLRSLSGRSHEVYTGITLVDRTGSQSKAERSVVWFRELSNDEIRRYIQSGEPMDKAGAYALQGYASLWITHMEGSYSSVIGLPLYLVRRLLLSSGYPLPHFS